VTNIIVLLVVLAIIALYIRNQKYRTGTQTAETGSGPLPYMKKDYLTSSIFRKVRKTVWDGTGGSSKNTSIS